MIREMLYHSHQDSALADGQGVITSLPLFWKWGREIAAYTSQADLMYAGGICGTRRSIKVAMRRCGHATSLECSCCGHSIDYRQLTADSTVVEDSRTKICSSRRFFAAELDLMVGCRCAFVADRACATRRVPSVYACMKHFSKLHSRATECRRGRLCEQENRSLCQYHPNFIVPT